jgi:hypothetical protein
MLTSLVEKYLGAPPVENLEFERLYKSGAFVRLEYIVFQITIWRKYIGQHNIGQLSLQTMLLGALSLPNG